MVSWFGWFLDFFIFVIFCVFFLFGILYVFGLVYGVLGFGLMDWGFVGLKFLFGEVRFYFSFVLLLVGLGVILFVSYYMGWDYNLSYFMVVFLVFFFRMFFLMLSGSVLVYVLG